MTYNALCSGPGKLTEALGITIEHKTFHSISHRLRCMRAWEPSIWPRGVRIGIAKAVDLPWRDGVKGSKFLSKPFRFESK